MEKEYQIEAHLSLHNVIIYSFTMHKIINKLSNCDETVTWKEEVGSWMPDTTVEPSGGVVCLIH